ncbi:hypothetical protein AVDCRST_MAG92-171 [uncultured Coleofasciculus sp.]|uniref:Uncharacterized protein n=1 Tax=uncultured Coleofasciculus sp. TaxID=1267456 RepID=A0A6J4H4Q7_9CYAN|nr:hypothetical protein AVDCRST_MAG92-171 [uncultured Coleofasciculus sp.]
MEKIPTITGSFYTGIATTQRLPAMVISATNLAAIVQA